MNELVYLVLVLSISLMIAASFFAWELGENRNLSAENKRLREVLTKIRNEPNLNAWTANEFRELAANALKKDGPK